MLAPIFLNPSTSTDIFVICCNTNFGNVTSNFMGVFADIYDGHWATHFEVLVELQIKPCHSKAGFDSSTGPLNRIQ